MNCHGVGKFTHEPVLKDIGEDKTCYVAHFNLVFSRLNGREREYSLLPCTVWGTAAEYVVNNFNKGDLIEVVDAIAQNFTKDNQTKIVFRINKFNKIQHERNREPETGL